MSTYEELLNEAQSVTSTNPQRAEEIYKHILRYSGQARMLLHVVHRVYQSI